MGEAPLRENLAAGILRLAKWSPGIPLLDPMCGSGTFLLEAALMALDIAPGLGRHFAFEKFRNFDWRRWRELSHQSACRQKAKTPQAIYGSDLSGDVLKAARTNLAAAGLEKIVSLKQANVLEISAPAKEGIIVTNPPYGVRVSSDKDLRNLYAQFGNVVRAKCPRWHVAMLSGSAQLQKSVGLKFDDGVPLVNGGLQVRLGRGMV